MTHPSYILYCVNTDEKTTESVNLVITWEGVRMQRFELASALRYFLVFFFVGGGLFNVYFVLFFT